jgi:small subunit ribosomal protein S2
MITVNVKDMLEAGVHFGHQTKRWNPKMRPYIYTARSGIYILNLQKTALLANRALQFVEAVAARGEKILFVGTKRQAVSVVSEEAKRAGMSYVNSRWLGGTLTNFRTIKTGIERLDRLSEMITKGEIASFTKKEGLSIEREKTKLEKTFSGIREMKRLPGALFIIDCKAEHIAIQEAKKLSIPVVAIVDTNCDPDDIDYVIPGNDDAVRSIKYFATRVADAAIEGAHRHQEMLAASRKRDEDDKSEREIKAEKRSDGIEVVKRVLTPVHTELPMPE